MYTLLKGMRIVEGASFIAAPLCGLSLLQMGAEVIRFDAIGGGPDFRRWPLAGNGISFYWEGLNKGKKSVAIDLSRPEGRELAAALATAPGDDAGLFVTNYPASGFLSHELLSALREDLITVRVMGWADGRQAVDYTVNASVGLPLMTGPDELGDAPVNHVLPAWDLLTGAYAAFALMAAERHRRQTGKGQEVRLPLGDIAAATLGNLGMVAETGAARKDRGRMGNDLYGAFGRDFVTADGRRVMIVAITQRQWSGLVEALGIADRIAAIEAELGASFARDEGERFVHRDRLNPVVAEAVGARPFADLARAFEEKGVCFEAYRTLEEALSAGGLFSTANPVFAETAHPSGGSYLTPGAPVGLSGAERSAPPSAPRLGQHTDEVLATVLGLPEAEIGRLHDSGIVAGAEPS